jgi:acyl-coenzyme A synthetase/AMP-(fatty) acid ligase
MLANTTSWWRRVSGRQQSARSTDTQSDRGAAPTRATVTGQAAPLETPAERPIEFHSVTAQFATTALRRRDQVALRAATQTVTYGELLSAARALAVTEAAEATGAAATTTVGGAQPRAALIAAPLNPATVATILGLFATRTAVVALDPAVPANRARHIAEILRGHGYQVTEVEVPATMPWGAVDMSAATDEMGSPADLDDVTSIQFTSGSTGAPKAVLHPNGLWLCDAQLLNDRFGLDDGRRVALCMPISFAAGLNVLIGSLLGGAEIVAVDPREYSATDALDRIASSAAEVITCTPAFVDALHTAAQGGTLPNVQRIVTTGEPAHARHVRLARELAPHAIFTNWVGSTEVLGIASFDVAPSAPLPTGVIPVGTPVRHKQVDVGQDGTVSVTSRYLGLRYLDPAAAAGTFVDNPDGTRTYAGGDVGRWDESGNLVLSGRADSTVKIRGYLVEPAEIESTLLSYDDVREAAVTADTTGTPTLTAYIALTTTGRTPSMAELRTRLHRDLPPWMVPTHIVPLAALPRTDRGKIDRMALPKADRPAFEPPRGEGEVAIASLWADLLHVEAVGRSDGFYAMGGDSLTVAQMLSHINETHGIELNPSDLASAPTVAQFAERLAGSGDQRAQPGGPRLSPTTVPLRAISSTTSGPPLMCFPGAGAAGQRDSRVRLRAEGSGEAGDPGPVRTSRRAPASDRSTPSSAARPLRSGGPLPGCTHRPGGCSRTRSRRCTSRSGGHARSVAVTAIG